MPCTFVGSEFGPSAKQSDHLSRDEELQTEVERKQRVKEGKRWIFGMLGRFLEFPLARDMQALGRPAAHERARQLRLGGLQGTLAMFCPL